MVQIYYPSAEEQQILIDVENIESDRLKIVEYIQSFMVKVVEKLKLDEIKKGSHRFQKDNVPYGV